MAWTVKRNQPMPGMLCLLSVISKANHVEQQVFQRTEGMTLKPFCFIASPIVLHELAGQPSAILVTRKHTSFHFGQHAVL